jgi:hypothetical protein
MMPRRFTLLAALAIALPFLPGAGSAAPKKQDAPTTQMDARKRAIHALNRLTFGARAGDVDRVLATGVDRWIEQQLHPEKIDDKLLDARLTSFRTLRMDTRELVENFPPPQVIKAVQQGRLSMPSDPARRAIYEAQMERLERKQDAKTEPPQTTTDDANAPATAGKGSAPLALERRA